MSSNLNYKQVTNVTRRTWDVETYAKKAKDRQQQNEQGRANRTTKDFVDRYDDNDVDSTQREEFMSAAVGAAGPEGSQRAYLKARKHKVIGIDDKIGSTEIISIEAATKSKLKNDDDNHQDDAVQSKSDVVKKTGVGWHCTVCDCFLKDSHTYLDHINGRKHQRALGYSMRVERSSKEQLLNKLQELSNDQLIKSRDTTTEITNFHDLVQRKDEEEKLRKEERQRKRKERRQRMKEDKKQQKELKSDDEEENEEDKFQNNLKTINYKQNTQNEHKKDCYKNEEEEEIEIEGIDPAMAAMMGFTDFGGSKK